MPVYRYQCVACGKVFSKFVPLSCPFPADREFCTCVWTKRPEDYDGQDDEPMQGEGLLLDFGRKEAKVDWRSDYGRNKEGK